MSAAPFDAAFWRRISDHFDHAAELAPQEREPWLSDLARTEPEVAGKLRELLADQPALSNAGFLEGPALDPGYLLSVLPPAIAGRSIGPWTIERLLGRGGMGEVWLAVRSDGRFESRCAIKFLDASVARPRVADRFRHEGRLLGRLTHPNIARLLDAGTTEDGQHYLTLEYVDGEPIDRYCETHGLGVNARVRLFLDVVSAVAHAHANLVIHRDLKPSNVLVTREGAVKLLDFGIAKLLSGTSEDDDATPTRFEEVALTPEYAAPEQLLGDLPSTTTDVWQLGMLLFVLLTGQHPVRSSGSRADRVRAALQGRIPRASDIATGSTRRELLGDLDAVLSMALRKDPRERYDTAAALREDLSRYLDHQPVSARRGAALYHARKFVQRHRLAVLASSVALASLCAALVFAFSQSRLAAGQRDRALALLSRNEAVTEFMELVITQAAESDKPIAVSDMLARSEELALADRGGNRENRAAVLMGIASFYHSTGDHGRSSRLLETALNVLGDSPDQSLRSELKCGQALVISSLGQNDAAARIMAHELAHLPTDPRAAAQCLHDQALISIVNLYDKQGALRYATAALERLRSSGRASTQATANFVETLATAYHVNGRHREAFSYYTQALRMLAELGRDRGAQSLVLRNNWAVSMESAGIPKSALQLEDDALAIMAATHPGERPYTLILNRGRALETIGRYRESAAAFAEAFQIATRTEAKLGRVFCLLGLSDASRGLGNMEAAKKYIDDAEEVLGPDEPRDSVGSQKLALARGSLYLAVGRMADARAQLVRALSANRSKVATIDVRVRKSRAELLSGNAATAAADARLALQDSTALQGGLPYSRRTGQSWLELGRALQALHDDVQARNAFAAAVDHLSHTLDADHPDLAEARRLESAARTVRSVR